MQNKRPNSLFGVQVNIARTHSQPVSFAHDWTAYDLDGEIQIPHHAPDYSQLRGVLLTEECRIRLDDVKEFRHYRSHAAKMSRPRAPVEPFAQSLDRDPGRLALWIHLLNGRREDNIDAFFLERLRNRFRTNEDTWPDLPTAQTEWDSRK